MPDIVTIAGSPSSPSSSTALLRYARSQLEKAGLQSESIVVRDLPAEDLLYGRLGSPSIQRATTQLSLAQGVIIATPIYKASYTGLLKAFLDLLPQNALRGKIVLPIVTGGSPGHLLAVDYALKPVLASLGAQHILQGVYILDGQLQRIDGEVIRFDETIAQRLRLSLEELAIQLIGQPTTLVGV